ncbi:MAG: transglutaminase-like domain-containing protein, partial [Olsenella sp.]|nr:transglutaminase-like domain-containing protein [Olsenella sp.]
KDETYTYDLSSDGTPNYYPLQMGDGTYRLTVYRNVTGNKYSTEGTKNIDVKLDNEFQPFMHPNVFSSYGERSAAVAQAQSLCAGLSTDTEKVSAIYQWLSKTIQYDYDFAKNPGDGYVPDPDRTLSTKKGICFDYASLAAAMIRSQQIPCKLITGYVQPNDIYHSWNMVYLQDKGWITTNIQASVDEWGRIDVTFEATGGDAQFVGNGSNYTTRYTY